MGEKNSWGKNFIQAGEKFHGGKIFIVRIYDFFSGRKKFHGGKISCDTG
jgi:hypothetical protein